MVNRTSRVRGAHAGARRTVPGKAITVGIVGGPIESRLAWFRLVKRPGVDVALLVENEQDRATVPPLERTQIVKTPVELVKRRPDGLVVTPDHLELAEEVARTGCALLVDDPFALDLACAQALVAAAAQGGTAVRWACTEALLLGELAHFLRDSGKQHNLGTISWLAVNWRCGGRVGGALARLAPRAFAIVDTIWPMGETMSVSVGVDGGRHLVLLRAPHLPEHVVIEIAIDPAWHEPDRLGLKAFGVRGSVEAALATTNVACPPPELTLTHAAAPPAYMHLSSLPAVGTARRLEAGAWVGELFGTPSDVGLVGARGLRLIALRDAASESEATRAMVMPEQI